MIDDPRPELEQPRDPRERAFDYAIRVIVLMLAGLWLLMPPVQSQRQDGSAVAPIQAGQ